MKIRKHYVALMLGLLVAGSASSMHDDDDQFVFTDPTQVDVLPEDIELLAENINTSGIVYRFNVSRSPVGIGRYDQVRCAVCLEDFVTIPEEKRTAFVYIRDGDQVGEGCAHYLCNRCMGALTVKALKNNGTVTCPMCQEMYGINTDGITMTFSDKTFVPRLNQNQALIQLNAQPNQNEQIFFRSNAETFWHYVGMLINALRELMRTHPNDINAANEHFFFTISRMGVRIDLDDEHTLFFSGFADMAFLIQTIITLFLWYTYIPQAYIDIFLARLAGSKVSSWVASSYKIPVVLAAVLSVFATNQLRLFFSYIDDTHGDVRAYMLSIAKLLTESCVNTMIPFGDYVTAVQYYNAQSGQMRKSIDTLHLAFIFALIGYAKNNIPMTIEQIIAWGDKITRDVVQGLEPYTTPTGEWIKNTFNNHMTAGILRQMRAYARGARDIGQRGIACISNVDYSVYQNGAIYTALILSVASLFIDDAMIENNFMLMSAGFCLAAYLYGFVLGLKIPYRLSFFHAIEIGFRAARRLDTYFGRQAKFMCSAVTAVPRIALPPIDGLAGFHNVSMEAESFLNVKNFIELTMLYAAISCARRDIIFAHWGSIKPYVQRIGLYLNRMIEEE